jgi:hypothetical protein
LNLKSEGYRAFGEVFGVSPLKRVNEVLEKDGARRV